ncbi:MAG TPA: hypothetical protein VK506_05925 [Conexibacter sp.]|nr:hypothetical protein [Conexibacter sp.]
MTTAVARKRSLLERAGATALTGEDVDISLSDLIDWYQDRCGSIGVPLDVHARKLGFSSTREFLSELLLDYSLGAERDSTTGPPRTARDNRVDLF